MASLPVTLLHSHTKKKKKKTPNLSQLGHQSSCSHKGCSRPSQQAQPGPAEQTPKPPSSRRSPPVPAVVVSAGVRKVPAKTMLPVKHSGFSCYFSDLEERLSKQHNDREHQYYASLLFFFGLLGHGSSSFCQAGEQRGWWFKRHVCLTYQLHLYSAVPRLI